MSPGPNGDPDAERPTTLFWFALVIGGAVMAWGAQLLLEAVPDGGRRLRFGLWIVGLDLAHDLVVAPMLIGAGWLACRARPAWLRAPFQVGLLVSGAVIAVGWLPLVGSAPAGNPTIQPLDYRTALATALAAVWTVVAAWAAVRWAGQRRAR